jgi:hypothetical protein
VSQYEKTDFLRRGERRSGEKDLDLREAAPAKAGRQPLPVQIQNCQAFEDIGSYTSDDCPSPKKPAFF